jgi:hypothetical protein
MAVVTDSSAVSTSCSLDRQHSGQNSTGRYRCKKHCTVDDTNIQNGGYNIQWEKRLISRHIAVEIVEIVAISKRIEYEAAQKVVDEYLGPLIL